MMKIYTQVSIDLLAATIVGIYIGLIELGHIPQNTGQFYCGDPQIGFKLQKDSVSNTLLGLTGVVPLIVVFFIEFILLKNESGLFKKFQRCILASWPWLKGYVNGIVMKQVLVSSLKIFIGEPRPHFLDTCQPDAAVNCTPGTIIAKYSCTNQWVSTNIMLDSMKSFPSGHSSIAAYETIFVIWYLQVRQEKFAASSILLVPFLQMACLVWGCYCPASRIIDHRHHWWDVLFGSVIGVIFASLTCAFLCKNFKSDIRKKSKEKENARVAALLSGVTCVDEAVLQHV